MVITAAWSEQPRHGDMHTGRSSRTSAHTTLAARHWRAAASASATASSVVSVRLSSPSWTDALCEDDASLSPWLARLSFFSSSLPLFPTVYYACSSSLILSLSVFGTSLASFTFSVCVCVYALAAVGRRRRRRRRWFRRGILVNDSGANIARGNIKNVRWDNVGLEEVWNQKRCWHPPPLTAALPRNT